MGFAPIVAFVNVVLCVVYAIVGRIPGFGNGLLPSNPIGAFVAFSVAVCVSICATRQYLSGSVAKTRFAMSFMFQSKRLALVLVLLAPAFLLLHAFFRVMDAGWGNLLFGALALLGAKVYYHEFTMFKEVSPAEVGAFMGIELPDVRAKKQRIRTIQICGINFGTYGTFFAAQWALAAFIRGLIQIVR